MRFAKARKITRLKCCTKYFVAPKSTFPTSLPTGFLDELQIYEISCGASVSFHHISQNATPASQFAHCHHLMQPWHCHSQKIRKTTRLKCCACHSKSPWWSPKSALATKNATHLFQTCQSIISLSHKRLSTRCEKCWNVTAFYACHAKRRYATFEASHTLSNGCAMSSEHTLNPQPPRLKREPLLRIRENVGCDQQFSKACGTKQAGCNQKRSVNPVWSTRIRPSAIQIVT